MKTNTWMFIIGLTLCAAFAAASGVAVHYRSQARHFQKEYLRAALDLEEIKAAPAPARVAPATTDLQRRPLQPIVQEVVVEQDTDMAERLAELERQLSDRDEMIAAMRMARRFATMPDAGDAEGREARERGDWLEELRESDPDRYEEIQRRRTEMRQRVQDSFARKAAHFLYRDVEALSEVEREEYDQMLGLLSETWSLAERLQSDELSREERWDARRAIMGNVRTLQPMLEAERDREFYDLGRQLGYDDQAAAQFVEYINDMIEVTSFSSIWRAQGRGMGMGMGGGR